MVGLDVPHKYMNKQNKVGAQHSSPSDRVETGAIISRAISTAFLGRRVRSNCGVKPWVLLALTFFLNFLTYLPIYLFISQVYVKARDFFFPQHQGLRAERTWLYLLETRLPHSIAEISEPDTQRISWGIRCPDGVS